MERLDERVPFRFRAARLWRNPGIRRLTALCGGALAVLLAFGWLFSVYESYQLKKEWLARDEARMGALAAAHPELAAELPALFVSEPDEAARDRGRELAARYGIDQKLPNALLPVIADHERRTLLWLEIGVAALTVVFSVAVIRHYASPLRDIRSLTRSLEEAVKRNRMMDFRLYGEGELGLLAHGVQELSLRLQETIAQLHRDKSFLKDTIADISHQLKTPLASLMIYTELLEDARTSPAEAKEFLGTCRRELERMEWLTLTLLKIARLEADALKLLPMSAPLAATIREAVEPVRALAEQRGVRVETAEPEPIILEHDARWLAEAIGNLVKNAVEHTPSGGAVTVLAERKAAYVRLTVRDEGPGIDERHLPHIFKKFYRAPGGTSVGGGVGLGLPLAKSIVERHEGTLTAIRNESGGSSFVMVLPLHRAADANLPLTDL